MARDFTYVIDFPDDGWVWGPEDGEDVAAWAQDVADDLRAEGPLEVELSAQLRAYGITFRERDVDRAALWIPQVDHGVICSRIVQVRVGDDERPLTLDVVEELERTTDVLDAERHEVHRVPLPAGPSVRCRRLVQVDQALGAPQLGEVVSHTIVPEPAVHDHGHVAAIRHTVSWQMLTEGDDLAELADDCAQLLTLERS